MIEVVYIISAGMRRTLELANSMALVVCVTGLHSLGSKSKDDVYAEDVMY